MKYALWASRLEPLMTRLLAVVTVLAASGSLADTAVQYHCAGGSQMVAGGHLSTLQKVLALPSTTNLEDIATARFSELLCRGLGIERNASSATLVEPLLRDVIHEESLGSFSGESADAPSFILAVRLDGARAQLWQNAFAKIFGGSGEKLSMQGFSGQRWNAGGTNSFWLIPAQGWLLTGCRDGFSSVQAEFLSQIKAQGRPAPALKDNWLEAEMDSSLLGGWFHLLKPARVSLSVAAQKDGFDISGRVIEKQDAPWKPAPWQIPTDSLHGQIISFTAGRDVAAFLNLGPPFSHLDGNPLTNQFYFWALDQIPLLNYMAWPETDASNALEKLAVEGPVALNPSLEQFDGTKLVWIPEVRKLILQNIRLFVPVLQAMRNAEGQYLFLSSFAPTSATNTPPKALLAEIEGHDDVVYYDWELTSHRVAEWNILSKMIGNRAMGTNSNALGVVTAESEWCRDLSGLAINTITKITRVSPNELAVKRNAPLGFTGLELILLADWIGDVNSGPVHPAPPELAIPTHH